MIQLFNDTIIQWFNYSMIQYTNYLNMETNIIAELRILPKAKSEDLIKSLELERTEEEVRFLWTKKIKTSYIDHYPQFLKTNTKLINTFNPNGFMLLYDLIKFLRQVKGIDLEDVRSQKFNTLIIELRDETGVLIDYEKAGQLIPQFNLLQISKEELFDFDADIKAANDIRQDVIFHQINQIKALGNALKLIKEGEMLFLRGFY